MKSAEIGMMSNIPNIKIYDIFRKDLRLPEAKAQELVQALDDVIKGNHEENLQSVATKEFVKEEGRATKEFVKEEIRITKEFVKEEIRATKEFVKEEIRTTKEFVKEEIRITKEFVKEEISATKEFVKEEIRTTKEFVKDEVHRLDLKVEQTKSELTKAIFWAGLIQFLAIVGSVIGIISFMFRK
jgi:hypothetical protein